MINTVVLLSILFSTFYKYWVKPIRLLDFWAPRFPLFL
jgi:hypothetical protein